MSMERRINNVRSFASPGKYIQGEGILDHIRSFTDAYGRAVAFIIDATLFDGMKQRLSGLYPAEYRTAWYAKAGEITLAALDALEGELSKAPADVFVGVGGGKTIDTAKVLAERCARPVIIVPTVASTDAPCSGLSIIYKESGEHSHEIFLKKGPDIVLVDSAVIARAPVRFLVSGMGDALSTYFEAMANVHSNYVNIVSSEAGFSMGSSLASREIARLCYRALLADGRRALLAAEQGIVTEALENIIEVNTLLSGVGFESNGTAAAHAINDGLTAVPTKEIFYHGERVAFGVLCELMMENAPDETVDEVYSFCVDVGLPVTLARLGIETVTEELLDRIAEVAFHNVIHAEPFVVTREGIKGAILAADRLGQAYLAGKRLR
ncbi:MAG: glycerol dehydrogenase [Treponema sp.]|jgi:glycerol dehydrogenase|nr:glycerol dehydrogenase [Treponema sp.]